MQPGTISVTHHQSIAICEIAHQSPPSHTFLTVLTVEDSAMAPSAYVLISQRSSSPSAIEER